MNAKVSAMECDKMQYECDRSPMKCDKSAMYEDPKEQGRIALAGAAVLGCRSNKIPAPDDLHHPYRWTLNHECPPTLALLQS